MIYTNMLFVYAHQETFRMDDGWTFVDMLVLNPSYYYLEFKANIDDQSPESLLVDRSSQ